MATQIVSVPAKPMQLPREAPVERKALVSFDSADNVFDPERHINFKQPSKIYTMQDLNLPEDTGISPVAVSEPFPLFTVEAIYRMREEILNDKVWSKCQYSSNLAQCQLRGFAAE